MLGLLSDLPRKNCWTIAEHARDAKPDGMQHLLGRAKWDADAVRDDIRTYVVDHLGDEKAVLVVDETGDLKKGTATVGVQRQYTGTAGRTENAQVAVYLVYSGKAGHAAIDRELYVPHSWSEDRQRCTPAGIPEQIGFATKPTLAARMITAPWTPASWRDGWPATRSTLAIPLFAPCSSIATSAVSSQSPAATRSPRWRETTGGCPGQGSAQASLAEALCRDRSEGPPLL